MPSQSLDSQPTEDQHLGSPAQETATPPVQIPDVASADSDPVTSVNKVSNSKVLTSPAASPIKRLLQRFVWGSMFAVTTTASALTGLTLALSLPLPGWLVPQHAEATGLSELWQSGFRYRVVRPVNLLLMGIDEVPNVPKDSPEVFAGRTDTLLLVQVDPEKHSTSVLSIPRDTRVRIPNYGMAKINQANVEGGPERVAQTVNANLGKVTIDRYVRVSTGAFREIVDLVGGVEVFVPKRMVYEDRTQGLHIDLQPGWQTLDGSQAEQFARFRKDELGDIGRVQRQQMLLKSLRSRLTSPTVIPKLPQIIRVLQRYIDTNLSLEEMLALANFALDMKGDNLQMVMLPGRFSSVTEYNASYWIADWEAGSHILQNFFHVDSVATLAEHKAKSTTDLSIAIQNASGTPDAARAVASYLHHQGFYNVYVTPDWPSTESSTQVVAQRGDVESAQAMATALGVGQVVSDSTGDLQSDITIRIGQDWAEHTQEEAPSVESGQ